MNSNGRKRFCPICGQAYFGTHACNQGSSYNENLLQFPEKMSQPDDKEEYQMEPPEEEAEYGMCDLCLKVKRKDLLVEISVEVPPEMALMTGSSVTHPKACKACLEEANKE